jgi:hypothetical protein
MFCEHAQIRIIGSKKDVEQAESAVKTIECLEQISEPKARLLIQQLIEEHNLKASILFDGNTVWDSRKIVGNLNRIIKYGTLYDGKHPGYVAVGSMLLF